MRLGTAPLLAAAAARCGFASVSADAAPAFDALLYDIVRTALDLVRLVTRSRTVQAEHLTTLARVAAVLCPADMAATATATATGTAAMRRRQRGGNPTGMPSEFYGVDGGQYGASSAVTGTVTSHDPSGAFARLGLEPSSPPFPMQGGGGGARLGVRIGVSDEVLSRLVQEYGARRGSVRVSAAARRALRSLVERNAARVLAVAGRRPRPGQRRRVLTAAALNGARRGPVLVF
jgi:hypothetical protein